MPLSYTVYSEKKGENAIFVTLGFCVRVNDPLYTQSLSIIGTVSVYPLIDQRIRHPGTFQLLLDILGFRHFEVRRSGTHPIDRLSIGVKSLRARTQWSRFEVLKLFHIFLLVFVIPYLI